MLIITVILTCCTWAVYVSAEGGSFPPTENIGKYKPVLTEGDRTCGGRKTKSYCEPASDESGLRDGACSERPCDLDCPDRERKPDGSGVATAIPVMNDNLLNRIIRLPKNFANPRPKLQAYQFYNHPSCYTQPKEVLQLGRSPSQFTLAVWINQQRGNAG